MYSRGAEGEVTMNRSECARVGLCVLFVVLVVLVDAGLQVGDKKCGQKKCDYLQYCDPHGMCDDCSRICDPTNNNYQQDSCEKQCQDYLHEQKFVMRGETSGSEDVNSKVARLTVLVIVTLVVVILVLLVLLAMLFLLYRYRKHQRPPVYSKSHGGVENGKANGGLKINMPPPPSTTPPPPVTPATTSTPLSTRPRFPKEDPTLEYGAYDNPALAPSPVFDNKESTPTATTTPVSRRQESSF